MTSGSRSAPTAAERAGDELLEALGRTLTMGDVDAAEQLVDDLSSSAIAPHVTSPALAEIEAAARRAITTYRGAVSGPLGNIAGQTAARVVDNVVAAAVDAALAPPVKVAELDTAREALAAAEAAQEQARLDLHSAVERVDVAEFERLRRALELELPAAVTRARLDLLRLEAEAARAAAEVPARRAARASAAAARARHAIDDAQRALGQATENAKRAALASETADRVAREAAARVNDADTRLTEAQADAKRAILSRAERAIDDSQPGTSPAPSSDPEDTSPAVTPAMLQYVPRFTPGATSSEPTDAEFARARSQAWQEERLRTGADWAGQLAARERERSQRY